MNLFIKYTNLNVCGGGVGGWRLAGDNECRMYVTHSIVYLYLLVLVHIACLEYVAL